MSTENLWGELPKAVDVRAPIEILREQAAILSSATNRVLIGSVANYTAGTLFKLDLNVIAPTLSNYIFTILTISHSVLMYPLNIHDRANEKGYDCKDEEEFRADLREILTSPKVHQVISSLLAQSKSNK